MYFSTESSSKIAHIRNIVNALLKVTIHQPLLGHVLTTGHNINWDHFDISELTELSLENYRPFIQELKLSLNVNDGSEKLLIY